LLTVIHQKQRNNNAGRRPDDVTLMFKMLVLQALYNLSDDQTEFQVLDRASFQLFLGVSPEDTVPDAKTLWVFREQLTRHGLMDKLFQLSILKTRSSPSLGDSRTPRLRRRSPITMM
jgi:hypothetical protein